MEGLAWLLMKMAALLALTGAAFFALGWWLRGRQTPLQGPAPARDLERLSNDQRIAESRREALEAELASVRAQLVAAEGEVRRLQSAPPAAAASEVPAELALLSKTEKVSKPKAPRKSRAKKGKA